MSNVKGTLTRNRASLLVWLAVLLVVLGAVCVVVAVALLAGTGWAWLAAGVALIVIGAVVVPA